MSKQELTDQLAQLEAEYNRVRNVDKKIKLLQEIGKVKRLIENKVINERTYRCSAKNEMGYSMPSKINNTYASPWRT
jgi:hypothetical protein